MIAFAYIYPMLTVYDKYGNLLNADAKHLSPQAAIDMFGFQIKYILGTGAAGQSTFDAIWNGSRISISLALICAAINMSIGVVIGAIYAIIATRSSRITVFNFFRKNTRNTLRQ
mgnify:CR=1 FL=1